MKNLQKILFVFVAITITVYCSSINVTLENGINVINIPVITPAIGFQMNSSNDSTTPDTEVDNLTISGEVNSDEENCIRSFWVAVLDGNIEALRALFAAPGRHVDVNNESWGEARLVSLPRKNVKLRLRKDGRHFAMPLIRVMLTSLGHCLLHLVSM